MRYCCLPLVVLLALPAALAAEQPAKKRPNVLFIAVDDLNDWIGPLGKRKDVKTPNIDKLAKRGLLFTRAYCAAPACNPSRTAILTGRRPSTSGVYHNNQPWRPGMPDVETLPRCFMRHGYLVVGGGKIFHNTFNDAPSWQQWIKAPAAPEPAKKPMNGIPNTAQFDWGPLDCRDEDMPDHKVVSEAIDLLKKKQEKPFFLAVGLIKPHLPFYAPKKYFDMYPLDKVELPKVLDNDLDDVPPAGVKMAKPNGDHKKVVEAGQWKNAVQAYLACITFTDYEIGRLLDALEASGEWDNTIIVLWSDHGWHLGEKQHWRKFALWEEATRVSFLIAAPGVTQPGSRCDRTVSLMDIYPTLMDLCGLKAKADLEARSLLPLLKNPKAEWNHPVLTTHGKGNHAVRSEQWRYIRYADGSEELYDHDADPYEWKNLAKDARYADVKKQLGAHLPKVDAPDVPGLNKKDKQRRTALEQLSNRAVGRSVQTPGLVVNDALSRSNLMTAAVTSSSWCSEKSRTASKSASRISCGDWC